MTIDFGLGPIPFHEFAIACIIIIGIAAWRIKKAMDKDDW